MDPIDLEWVLREIVSDADVNGALQNKQLTWIW